MADICQRAVGIEHVLGLLFFTVRPTFTAGRKLRAGLTPLSWPSRAFDIKVQDMVEPEIRQKLLITGIGIQHTECAATTFQQVQGRASESSEEGGVHHGTAFEIDDQIPCAISDDGLERTFHLNRILKGAATLDTQPKYFANEANKNGGGCRHGRKSVKDEHR